jgi:ribosomal protein S1
VILVKKTIAIIVSVIFVLSFAGLSFAADKAAPMKKEAAAPAKAEEKAMDKKAPAKIKAVTGEVMAADATSITVKGKKGDVTATTSDKTKVMMGKEKKAIADVKVGDKVTLKYSEADGKNMAKMVSIHAAKPAEKKAEKKAVKKSMKKEKAEPAPAESK